MTRFALCVRRMKVILIYSLLVNLLMMCRQVLWDGWIWASILATGSLFCNMFSLIATKKMVCIKLIEWCWVWPCIWSGRRGIIEDFRIVTCLFNNSLTKSKWLFTSEDCNSRRYNLWWFICETSSFLVCLSLALVSLFRCLMIPCSL